MIPVRRFLAVFLLVFLPLSASAIQDSTIAALGQASLVLEEDSTQLTLFNGGNPAGLVFLPPENRLDLTFFLGQTERRAEFTPGLERAGDLSIYDPKGNTLIAESVVTRQSQHREFGFAGSGALGYGGMITHLNEHWTLQVDPFATGEFQRSTLRSSQDWDAAAGGRLRAAAKIAPGIAVGAGMAYSDRQTRHYTSSDQTFASSESMYPYDTFLALRERSLSGEAGAVVRVPSVFEEQDYLDLGVMVLAARPESRADLCIPNTSWASSVWWHDTLRSEPWHAKFQGVYQYENRMDIGLSVGYLDQKVFRALQTPDSSSSERLDSSLINWTYEMAIRLHIPMVREDDLRFGVVFSNLGDGHPFPTGRHQAYAPSGDTAGPPLDTLASSIGIGTAFIPDQGSIVALEYHLGSAKSRTGALQLAKSGFSRFGFGVQYALLKSMFLRLGFADLLVDHENLVPGVLEETLITHSEETQSFTFGLGFEEGPWRVDITTTLERVLHSPRGWTMLDKPVAIDEYGEGANDWDAVNQDKTERYLGQISLSLRF